MYVYHTWYTHKCMYVWTTHLNLVHPLRSHHHLGPHGRQPRFPPRIVRHETKESVQIKGSLEEKCFFGGEKS